MGQRVDPSHIIISGLRRSGTTIFWEALRDHPDVIGIDEPFHPRLTTGDRQNRKGTWSDLAPLLRPKGQIEPVAIEPIEELANGLSENHRAYLRALLNCHPQTVTDVVRCWNVTGEIGNLGDNVLPIHLVRSVQGWVQAQLLPTGPRRLRKRLFDIYREFSFFRRRGHFDNYHYQSIIDTALAERHAVWQHSNLSIEELKGAPAYVKLMAFWWGANLVSHAKLRGSNALLVTLEEFSEAPSKILSEVLDATSWTRHDFSTGQVRSVRAAHRSNATAWKKAGDAIGIPVELISGEPIGGQAMAAIFDKALDEAAR